MSFSIKILDFWGPVWEIVQEWLNRRDALAGAESEARDALRVALLESLACIHKGESTEEERWKVMSLWLGASNKLDAIYPDFSIMAFHKAEFWRVCSKEHESSLEDIPSLEEMRNMLDLLPRKRSIKVMKDKSGSSGD